MGADIDMVGFGILTMITPLSEKARILMRALLHTEPHQWAGDSLFVESETLPGILDALGEHLAFKPRGGSMVAMMPAEGPPPSSVRLGRSSRRSKRP